MQNEQPLHLDEMSTPVATKAAGIFLAVSMNFRGSNKDDG
jgi:hypothetical protein